MDTATNTTYAQSSEANEEAIRVWRTSLLDAVANNLASDGHLQTAQKDIGVWAHGGGMPYPKRRDIKITNAESMTFSVRISNHEVLFSVWVMTGEVRIGVKVPNALAMTSSITNKIACAYDGKPCHRMARIESDMMYDWIWQDREFATFEYMSQALMNSMGVTIMVDRITQILVHIYLAVTSTLLTTHKLIATHGIVSKHNLELFHIKIGGDVDTLRYFVEKAGGEIKEIVDIGRKISIASILIPPSEEYCFKGPYLRDQDDGMCEILLFQKGKIA